MTAHTKAPAATGAQENKADSGIVAQVFSVSAPPPEPLFLTGQNVNQKGGFACCSFSDLVARCRAPSVGPKNQAAWFAPYIAKGKTKEAATAGTFHALVLDHDTDNLSREDLALLYDCFGMRWLAFTTSSHLQTDERHPEPSSRWKVVIPFSRSVNAAQWAPLAQGAAKMTGTDAAQVRVQQFAYMPNKLTDAAPYDWIEPTDAPLLDPLDDSHPFIMGALAYYAEERQQTAEAAPLKPRAATGTDGTIIEKVNATRRMADVLAEFGYEQQGRAFLAPESQSGIAGVHILTGKDGRELAYSHHSHTNDQLADGHAHDVFSVLTILQYGGDAAAAVKAEADKVDPEGQKQRQRDYMQSKAADVFLSVRPFVDLLADAKNTDQDTPPEILRALALDAGALDAISRRKVFDALKQRTGIPVATFNQMLKESQSPQEDHLTMARGVVDGIGRENVISAQSFVWVWDPSGVWEKLEDRAVKQIVQTRIEDAGVTKNLVESVADLFKTEVFRPGHEFDTGPVECVNTLNGELVLNGADWQLTPANREHYRTTQIPVRYDPAATAPRFQQFLCEVFAGDPDAPDKSQALLEMMGYSLMAHCRHEKFIILVGAGANGKSVLLAVLEALLGSRNVAGVQPSQFDRSFQRAHLHGRLANIVTEIKQGEVIDDASLKGIVSGEPTTVEHKFKDPFDMRPFATCWFGTNHMPHTRDFSDALFRRALVVEFNNTFKPELGNCDPQLKDRLMAELPGILNLSLQAYQRALNSGFTLPASCKEARTKWRLEADQVAQFVDEVCIPKAEERTEPKRLFNAYTKWAVESGIQKRVSLKSFSDRMIALGYERQKSSGIRFIKGIALREGH